MRIGERPTPHQALARKLAIGVGLVSLATWALLASGWDLGKLTSRPAAPVRPLAAKWPAPKARASEVIHPFSMPTEEVPGVSTQH